jgi:hypothetical protein
MDYKDRNPVIDPSLWQRLRIATAASGYSNVAGYVNAILAYELDQPIEKRHVPFGLNEYKKALDEHSNESDR